MVSSVEFTYQAKPRAKCSVSGAKLLMFCVSRVACIAPVRFERRRGVWSVSVSPALCILTFVVATVINAVAVAGLVLDMKLPPAKAIRASTPTRRFAWTSDFFIVTLSMSLGAYKSPWRIEEVIRCLDVVQKIESQLEGNLPRKTLTELKKCVPAALFVLFAMSIVLADFCDYTKEMHKLDRDKLVRAFYVGYFLANEIMFLLEMQFIVTATEVHNTLRSVNDMLESAKETMKQSKKQGLLFNNFVVPANTVNKVVDSMVIWNDKETNSVDPSKILLEKIQRHMAMFDQLCSTVIRLNQCFGPELTVIIASCLLHLIITPYNLILTIYEVDAINFSSTLMQVIWCSWHLWCTISVVEPSHKTQIQMDRTNRLVSELLLQNTDELVHAELERFAASLLLKKVVYSPMGTCTLTRSLVVSMVGSVATYLVIIVQFQSKE